MQSSNWVTKEELKAALREIGATTGTFHHDTMTQVNSITKAFNELREQLGHAQNVTAQVVDEDRDLLNTVILHQKYIMEKLGALTADGEWTEEFQQWCSAKIEEAQAIQAAAGNVVN